MALEDIRDQVQRTEDLIRYHIQRLEREQEFAVKTAEDHTNESKKTRNTILGGIGVLFSAVVTLFSASKIQFNDVLFPMSMFAIVAIVVYLSWNVRLRQLNDAFGLDIFSFDQRLAPLRAFLEFLILMTINGYQGHFKAIREVATLVSILNDATQLYNIKSTEKLIKTKTFRKYKNAEFQKSISYLKGEANWYRNQYKNLRHERIPLAFRQVMQSVFNDNKEFINQYFSEP